VTETDPHYVESYRAHVENMKAMFEHDEAMSVALGGGDFTNVGNRELEILRRVGLAAGDRVIDVGCGSGRLAAALTTAFGYRIHYLGTDVVEELLEHARKVSNSSYQFELNLDLTIPADDESCDYIVFFSVITHLLHEESFRYLRDAVRALKPGGTIIATFLESQRHWSIFQRVVDIYDQPAKEPLVMFIERPMLQKWCDELGLTLEQVIDEGPLGQSIAVLQRPA